MTTSAAPKPITHPTEDGAYQADSVLWFEYHCWESHQSSDAQIWYRSHQLVTVIELHVNDSAGMSREDRTEQGMPFSYTIRFADGSEWEAFEDELSPSRDSWSRRDPPTEPAR